MGLGDRQRIWRVKDDIQLSNGMEMEREKEEESQWEGEERQRVNVCKTEKEEGPI